MSSDVVDLHICICMRRSCDRAGLPAPFHLLCRICSLYWPVTRSHVTAAVFQTRARFGDIFTSDFVEWRSTVLWALERRRAQSSCSVCCEGSFGDLRWESEWVTDWRRPGASPLSRVVLLCSTPHRGTTVSCLRNYTLTTSRSSTTCYDYWRQASPPFCALRFFAEEAPRCYRQKCDQHTSISRK